MLKNSNSSYPLPESLEEEHVSLLKERYDMISKCQWHHDDDANIDLAIFFRPLSAPLETESDMEQTDELGRTTTKPNPADEQRQ
jgi:GC-rich sequence DNA-binding factor